MHKLKQISKGIENASRLGIQLYHPHFNSADGNCAFESVIDNIITRPCFEERYVDSPDYYRAVWMAEVERIGYENWNMGLSMTEWHEGWNLIKKSRAFEHCLGDLVVPGIAHATRKNILIFNSFDKVFFQGCNRIYVFTNDCDVFKHRILLRRRNFLV